MCIETSLVQAIVMHLSNLVKLRIDFEMDVVNGYVTSTYSH